MRNDILAGWVGVGSQLDGLGHIGVDNLYFNCSRAADFALTDELTKLGSENVPAIAMRGVLLDVASYFGGEIVKEGTAFNRAEIDGALKRQRVGGIENGDIVLFLTGWTKLIGVDDARYGAGEPGLGVERAKYLAPLELAMVGADSLAVGVIPAEPRAGTFEVHQILLARNGIYVLENIDTDEMVKDEA